MVATGFFRPESFLSDETLFHAFQLSNKKPAPLQKRVFLFGGGGGN